MSAKSLNLPFNVFVFSSHDPQVQAEADDTIFIRDGRIVNIERQAEQKNVAMELNA